MAEGGNLPATALNYAEVHSINQPIKNGCITITFLEQTRSERGTGHFPSWKKYMRGEVLQNAMKLAEGGRADSEAGCSTWADSGITNGLVFKLDIKGVEVSDKDKKNFIHRMRQYLKKMSKTVPVEVQTARGESSRLDGQGKVATPNRNSRELRIVKGDGQSDLEVLCDKLCQSNLVVFVPQILPLKQDNSVISLYEGNGQIPFAFTPTIRMPLNSFRACAIPVFLPERSFIPYVKTFSWSILRRGLNWMIASPHLRGCERGLIPFRYQSSRVPKPFIAYPGIHPLSKRVGINPPVDNQEDLLDPPVDNQGDLLDPPVDNQGDLLDPPVDNQGDLLASPRIQKTGAEPSKGSASNALSSNLRIVHLYDSFPPLPPCRNEEVNYGLNTDMRALSLDTLETHQHRTPVKAPSTDNNNNEKQCPHRALANTHNALVSSLLSLCLKYSENGA